MAYIYIHIAPNGKRYIGTTQKDDPKERWDSGWGYKNNRYFFSAIKKYGWNNFKHQVIEVNSKEDMWYGEKYLIAYYNTTDCTKGYNLSSGGENSNFGCKYSLSDEARKNISESKIGEKNPNYGKSTWNKGKHTPYRGGGMKKGTVVKKHQWITPDGDIKEMGAGQVHRFHQDWTLIK